MPSDKKRDFGRYLAEVVAKEIPVQFVSSVTVIFKSGKRARLTKEDLSHPLPLEKNLTWDKVEEGFENVQNVEIHIDLEALGNHVRGKTDSLFDKHFNDDEDDSC
jgi:hypothetical protein|tara:strand:+ start:2857 stop:3171 length:315 start_codon:yes stop_codon:yes gene_type:complete